MNDIKLKRYAECACVRVCVCVCVRVCKREKERVIISLYAEN